MAQKTAKEKITELLRTTNRAGMEELLEWMQINGFYNAPCSSKYHLAKPGGLAEHSLNVFHNALAIVDAWQIRENTILSETSINSIVIVSLLHDIGKCGQFGKPNYVITNDTAMKFAQSPATYATNAELLYVPHEIRSISILSQFIELTEEEQFAILYHNGLYGELKGFKGKETPLYMILHFSDMWAARVNERED